MKIAQVFASIAAALMLPSSFVIPLDWNSSNAPTICKPGGRDDYGNYKVYDEGER